MNSDSNNKDKNESNSSSSKAICIRLPFWLNAESAPVFCWLHLPNNQKISNMGMVVCNPLGYEYSHCHRTVRHLCDSTAASGQAVIRFDYHGTGDSFSDLFEPSRINTFLKNIHQVIQFLKNEIGVSQICLLGIRLGATLAATYCKDNEIDKLILWTPCVKGRAYVREMKALEKLASHSDSVNSNDKDFIDSGGFIVTDETTEELGKINLLTQQYRVKNNILVIERDDLQANSQLIEAIKTNSSTTVEHYSMAGYIEMMAEPQHTTIPQTTIKFIQQWIGKQSSEIDLAGLELATTASETGNNLTEELYLDPVTSLFGIFTYSGNKPNKNKPIVLIVNSGSVHHVGPNRVYTELVREVALAGFTSFRMDLANLGDSVQGKPFNENHPYPSNATENIHRACDFLKQQHGFNAIIITGLCSGVHNSFHAGLSLPEAANVNEFILINPLAFYREPDGEFDLLASFKIEKESQQYAESIFDSSKWRKLLSGKVDLKNLVGFIFAKLFRTLINLLEKLFSLIGLGKKSQLSKDLLLLAAHQRKITFIISSKDPGKQILMAAAKKTVNKLSKDNQLCLYDVPNADHTFSAFECRKNFKSIFIQHLQNRYG